LGNTSTSSLTNDTRFTSFKTNWFMKHSYLLKNKAMVGHHGLPSCLRLANMCL